MPLLSVYLGWLVVIPILGTLPIWEAIPALDRFTVRSTPILIRAPGRSGPNGGNREKPKHEKPVEGRSVEEIPVENSEACVSHSHLTLASQLRLTPGAVTGSWTPIPEPLPTNARVFAVARIQQFLLEA